MTRFTRSLAVLAVPALFAAVAAPASAQQYTSPMGGQAVYAAPSYSYGTQPPTYAAPAPAQTSFGPQDSYAIYGSGSPQRRAGYDWTGCYIGGYAGGAFSGQAYAGPFVSRSGRESASSYFNGNNGGYNYDLGDSAMGGGTVGCNYQFGSAAGTSHVVIGGEGEAGLLNVVGNGYYSYGYGSGNGRYDKTSISSWDSVVAGRLGVAFDRGLIYGKAGVFFANTRTPVSENCAGCTFYGNDERTITGGAYGGGVEYALDNAWSLKAEYMYLDTATSYDVCGYERGAQFCSTHDLAGTHTLKLGLNYKFTTLFSGGPAYSSSPRW